MKTKIVGLKDLRENMESYISEVKKGKSFTIVRRSTPIFKLSPVDEWGDEGTWETVLDLGGKKEGGMSAQEFLKRLKHG
jgi:prevent-host-death family protein